MWKFLKEYSPYYKNYKKEIVLIIIGILLVSSTTAFIAYLIKPVLDKIFIEKNEQMLYILPFVIILTYFLKGVGRFLQSYYVNYIGEDIIRQIRDKFLFHILSFEIIHIK